MVVSENFENLNDQELQKFDNTFIAHLIDYSKKYRSISCPNTIFVNIIYFIEPRYFFIY